MNYMVMECHLSYAVVLSDDGRFLKVANRHYEVGQTLTDIIEMKPVQSDKRGAKVIAFKWVGSILATAACLAMILTAIFTIGTSPYASVYMTINPEVRIDVNKRDIVVGLEGINADGKDLITDYSYKSKDLDLVMDELVNLAIEMGYLHEGGQITLTLDSESNEWVITKSDSLKTHLNEHLTNRLSVTIDITNGHDSQGAAIQIDPNLSSSDSTYDSSDYGNSSTVTASPDAGTSGSSSNSNESQTNDDNTDYGSNNDGVTDYNDTDNSSASDDGDSNYAESEGDSNYSEGDSAYTDDSGYDDYN